MQKTHRRSHLQCSNLWASPPARTTPSAHPPVQVFRQPLKVENQNVVVKCETNSNGILIRSGLGLARPMGEVDLVGGGWPEFKRLSPAVADPREDPDLAGDAGLSRNRSEL